MGIFGLGIGSRVAEQLARKGIGALDLVDHDTVSRTNLNRTYYFDDDVDKFKAVSLTRNLAKAAVSNTLIRAYPVRAETYFQRVRQEFDIGVCLVDDEDSRTFVAREMQEAACPCIFGAASLDGNSCRVFVQERGSACYACAGGFGGARACGGFPAVGDIQNVVASIVVYAIDTLLMKRARHWNLRQFFLSGGELSWRVPASPDCNVCGSKRTLA